LRQVIILVCFQLIKQHIVASVNVRRVASFRVTTCLEKLENLEISGILAPVKKFQGSIGKKSIGTCGVLVLAVLWKWGQRIV